MIGTNGCPGCISEHAVNSQNEVDDGITSPAAGEGVSISSGGIVLRSIPCIRQLVCTNCCPGSISENTVYSQDEVDNRITASGAGECVSVRTGGVDVITIPAIWQLVGTNGSPGSISEHTVYRQDEVNDRVTTASADEGVSVCTSRTDISAIPAIWQLVGTDGSSRCIA